jgi:hypothetical protein
MIKKKINEHRPNFHPKTSMNVTLTPYLTMSLLKPLFVLFVYFTCRFQLSLFLLRKYTSAPLPSYDPVMSCMVLLDVLYSVQRLLVSGIVYDT